VYIPANFLTMLIKDIISAIEAYAPTMYQESYDNCGLQVGNPYDEATGVLITLDVTEDILDEALTVAAT
jgi:putative NIF3 family GTP cyclohydrolase 1 type 2